MLIVEISQAPLTPDPERHVITYLDLLDRGFVLAHDGVAVKLDTAADLVATQDRLKPGKILELWWQLRKRVGIIEAKKKDGVKFKVRSSEDLIDKVREESNELGILIYPSVGEGKGHVVEDGTLAEQNLRVIAQAVEDGSCLVFTGFGLGADTQDKAGGKAGTYAFKAALIQALLAGGKENAKKLGVADTDDEDEPIAGGVKPKTRKKGPTPDEVKALFDAATDEPAYKAAVAECMKLQPAQQVTLKETIQAAKARITAPSSSAPTTTDPAA